MTAEEGVKRFPELAAAYGALEAARLLAVEKITRPVDQDGFVERVREQIGRRIEAGEQIKDARTKSGPERGR